MQSVLSPQYHRKEGKQRGREEGNKEKEDKAKQYLAFTFINHSMKYSKQLLAGLSLPCLDSRQRSHVKGHCLTCSRRGYIPREPGTGYLSLG